MLINCVAYQDGRKLADIAVDEISDYLAVPDCFVWVALRGPGDDELAAMQDEFGLHELAVEDARHGHQRPKIEEYGDSLFVVLHPVERHGRARSQSARSTSSSARTTSCRCAAIGARASPTCARAASASRQLLRHGSGFVLYALMDAVVDRYFPVLDELEVELEQVEETDLRRLLAARQHRGALRA